MKMLCKIGFHKYMKSGYSKEKCVKCGFEHYIGITGVLLNNTPDLNSRSSNEDSLNKD
jgi:hypothetical protein